MTILDISGFDNLRIHYDELIQKTYEEFANRVIAQATVKINAIPSILNGLTETEGRILSEKIKIYRYDFEDIRNNNESH